MKRVLSLIAVIALASSANGANLLPLTEGGTNGTFNSSGRRSADYYFNIQDSSNGSYACWSAVKWSALDLVADGNSIENAEITLQLHQANASFTTDGSVDLYLMPDTFDPSATATTYADWVSTWQSQSTLIDTLAFVETASGDMDQYTFTGAIADAVANSADDGNLVLAFVENGTVSATWAGVTSFSYDGPTIGISGDEVGGEVPEPASLMVLFSSLAAFGVCARRRKA